MEKSCSPRQTNNFFNIADQLEAHRDKIIYFLIHEAGKTYKDAIDEIPWC